MSIIFGVCKSAGDRVAEDELRSLAQSTARYALDGLFLETRDEIGMGYQHYRTHGRSNLESQPAQDAQGNLLVFDGRLDNHREISDSLMMSGEGHPDSQIVLAAFRLWRERCFARFVGDWAMALWVPAERALYLARDHAGVRTLYFKHTNNDLLWATHLETLIAGNSSFSLEEKYVAAYLVCQSVGDLTPYQGILSVPPAHYLVFRAGGLTREIHWRPVIKEKLSFSADVEYERGFLTLFRQAVERRTGREEQVLAQLSGGMDSSAIVCISDLLRREAGVASNGLIDTVSYYDDSDPNWDEAPYYSCVEKRREKPGIHISLPLLGEELLPSPVPYALPGADMTTHKNELKFEDSVGRNGYRAILSGIGGDELTGGVPTPFPELADYLATGELSSFVKRTLAWCLIGRTPFLHMSVGTIRFLAEQYLPRRGSRSTLPPWCTKKLRKLICGMSGTLIAERSNHHGPPSEIWMGQIWQATLDSLSSAIPGYIARREYRYPYLDRDLVEFLLQVPRHRLLQPGRRRSMMRSALRDIVPPEVLNRRRKASRRRAVLIPLQNSSLRLRDLVHQSHAAAIGLIDPSAFDKTAADALRGGDQQWLHAITRLVLFELWHQAWNPHVSLVTERSGPDFSR